MAEREQYGMGRKRVPSQKAGMGRATQLGAAARGLGETHPEWRGGWSWCLSKDAPDGRGDDDAQNHTANDDHDLLLQGDKGRPQKSMGVPERESQNEGSDWG